MAKIRDYDLATDLTGAEYVVGVQTDASVKMTTQQIRDYAINRAGSTPIFVDDDYAPITGEAVYCDTTIKPITITFPAGEDLDSILVMDDGHNASNHNITILTTGVETVDGDDHFIIDQNEGWCNAAFDAINSNWRIAVSGTPDLVNVPIDGPVKTRTVRTAIKTIENATAGNFDFDNIPSGFDRLIIKGQIRSDAVAPQDNVYVFLNDDTTLSNYHSQYGVVYDGATADAEVASPIIGESTAASSPSGEYWNVTVEIEAPDNLFNKTLLSHYVSLRASGLITHGSSAVTTSIATSITRLRFQTDNDPTDQLLGTLTLYGELDEEIGGGNGYENINEQIGTTYEFTSSDLTDVVTADNVSDSTYLIPDDLGIPARSALTLYNKGLGEVTIAMAGTDTLDTNSNKCSSKKAVTILKIEPTVWAVIGGTA